MALEFGLGECVRCHEVWREEEYHFALFFLLLFGKRYTNSGNILAWEKNLFFFFLIYRKESITGSGVNTEVIIEYTQKTLHMDITRLVYTKIRQIKFIAAKDGKALYSQQKEDWELTGSDHELLITKFRLKLKEVGKATRPFRYDLNQIPQDYTVEVTKQIQGIRSDRVPDELWTEVHDIVQEAVIKTIPKKKKCKKAKWLSEEALQIAVR